MDYQASCTLVLMVNYTHTTSQSEKNKNTFYLMHYTEWLLLSIKLAEKRDLDKLGTHLCVGIPLSTFNTIWYKL